MNGTDICLSANSSSSLDVGIRIDSNIKYTRLDCIEVVKGRIHILEIEVESKTIVLLTK